MKGFFTTIGLAALAAGALVLGTPAAPAAGEAGAEPAQGAQTKNLTIAILMRDQPRPRALTELEPFYPERGIEGARLGVADNNTTGQFTNQHFEVDDVVVPQDGDVVAAFKKLVADGRKHILVRLPADELLELADLPGAEDVLLYNLSARDNRLRNAECRKNVIHIVPSRAMLADALAQYLVKKKWKRWFLVVGQEKSDELYAEAIRRAAKRFGARIVEEKKWAYSAADIRRTAEAEIPVFTQGVDYHVLVVADETGWFGKYLMYRTWDPRLVAGTQGLAPTAWHSMHERWGAVQMQNRFEAQAGRPMTPVDHTAWIAVRAIGEAATRTDSVDFAKIRDYLLGPDFVVAAFKGVGLSVRSWDHQIRMPILLATAESVVSVSPQEGFLHPTSEMDTLGFDEPETGCSF